MKRKKDKTSTEWGLYFKLQYLAQNVFSFLFCSFFLEVVGLMFPRASAFVFSSFTASMARRISGCTSPI